MNKQSIVKKIKEKKELSGLVDQVVKDSLDNYLKKHKISLENISKIESKLIVILLVVIFVWIRFFSTYSSILTFLSNFIMVLLLSSLPWLELNCHSPE